MQYLIDLSILANTILQQIQGSLLMNSNGYGFYKAKT